MEAEKNKTFLNLNNIEHNKRTSNTTKKSSIQETKTPKKIQLKPLIKHKLENENHSKHFQEKLTEIYHKFLHKDTKTTTKRKNQRER